jgi:hypothetical protein
VTLPGIMFIQYFLFALHYLAAKFKIKSRLFAETSTFLLKFPPERRRARRRKRMPQAGTD